MLIGINLPINWYKNKKVIFNSDGKYFFIFEVQHKAMENTIVLDFNQIFNRGLIFNVPF